MRRLRGAVASREMDLERAIDRENSYRVQLKRLAAEAINARQLSDSRHAELERLAQSLTDSEKELKLAQKEISTLKKNARQDKRQRELANGKLANDGAGQCTREMGMIDDESRGIDDTETQLTSRKNIRQRSMKPRSTERTMLSSGITSSSDRTIDEPLTVTEILAKL
ncbi:uncharacterized protein [Venturia canescens]|uniref:uncharacterized protein n=1 Tax=Venturia canescens TaxID=32260 RepID=UPI001C9C04E8|nr:uncharacterized protein LOC122415213 [Venturia canescens]